jgi:protein-disulfide isomerase
MTSRMTRMWLSSISTILGLSFILWPGPAGLAASPDEEVIATLNGRPIYLSEVEENAAFQVYRLRSNIYSLLQKETEELVNQRLLAAEAARQGLSVEALLKKEVNDKVPPLGEKEVDEYLAQHPGDAGKGPDKKTRVRTYLYQRALAQRKIDLIASLREKADFQFHLKPPDRPRVKVKIEGEPWRGDPDAPVTLVHFADFTSRVCADSVEKIKKAMEAFPGKVKWVHRNFFSIHDSKALLAAELGEAAWEQGGFWDFHDRLFARRGVVDQPTLTQLGSEAGLDRKKFMEGQKKGSYLLRVKEDIGYGVRLGIQGAPVIFVNGLYFSGTFPYEDLRALVQKELERPPSP